METIGLPLAILASILFVLIAGFCVIKIAQVGISNFILRHRKLNTKAKRSCTGSIFGLVLSSIIEAATLHSIEQISPSVMTIVLLSLLFLLIVVYLFTSISNGPTRFKYFEKDTPRDSSDYFCRIDHNIG